MLPVSNNVAKSLCWAGLGLVCVVLSGCATRGGPVPYDVQGMRAPDSERPDLGSLGEIGPMDTLAIKVYELPEMDREVVVDRDGLISLPLIGQLQANGLTTTQLAREITSRLAARYVRSPSVNVAMKATMPRTITVEGSVNKPGVFPVTGTTTLLGAVAMASGPSDTANVRRVAVFRQIQGQRFAAAFDLSEIRKGLKEDPRIFPNDTVVIDGSGLAKAYREMITAIPVLYTFTRF